MTTKTHGPIATAQNTADKATKAAQDAHKRAQDAAQALESAEAEHTRVVSLVGAGKATADALATANHNLTHAQEVAQATATYATEQESIARLTRLGVAQAHIDHFADGRDQAVSHMEAITEHIRALISLNAERNSKAADILALLRAEGVAVGKKPKGKPRDEDAGLMIQDLRPAISATYIQHPEGRFEVNHDIAGAIVANAIARATEGNLHKLNARINLVGRFDRGQLSADVVRHIYGS
ncbi:hypothetical protein ABZY32_16470 [Nocardiopsis alba]|uniref:hypothetical protein n=1 Tax=Nocardiopsis alba TaxID=53437 RepID=UPI00339E58DD